MKPSAHRLCRHKWTGNEKMEDSVDYRKLVRLKIIRQLVYVVKQVVNQFRFDPSLACLVKKIG